ncbi:hypothetical protein BJF96_g9789 [Verticillium dahliae]|uniref:Uncharacterized protein n=1 Tax=Verticillium dahliae TaxID=27337 RepID=A0AA45AH66_VERDA|nr:hypothetical protein BJF96_g9789 [Verticillium dahliae]
MFSFLAVLWVAVLLGEGGGGDRMDKEDITRAFIDHECPAPLTCGGIMDSEAYSQRGNCGYNV